MTDCDDPKDACDTNEALHPKSKSQIKREMHGLQTVGLQLAELSVADEKALDLSEKLTDALALLRGIKSHSAKKRQTQYIGRLLRQEADSVASITDKLEALSTQKAENNHRFHQLEKWRDRLIAGDETALTDYVRQHPNVDIQQLRQLIRNSQKAQGQNHAFTHQRKLFRYLRDVDSTQSH